MIFWKKPDTIVIYKNPKNLVKKKPMFSGLGMVWVVGGVADPEPAIDLLVKKKVKWSEVIFGSLKILDFLYVIGGVLT